MSSESRTALVTGSTRGIGFATARLLIERGWRVGINGRDADRVHEAAARLGAAAVEAPFDVADDGAVFEGMGRFRRDVGAVHAVVHSAGTMKDAPLGMMTRDLIDGQLANNLVSALLVTQTASRILKRGTGSVVLIGSVAGEDGAAGQVLYAATKAGIGGVVRSAAKELGPRGIRVNGVVPGIIDTDLSSAHSPELLDTLARAASLRRIGGPDEVAAVIAFLVSDDARFVTGEMIRITGGMTLP